MFSLYLILLIIVQSCDQSTKCTNPRLLHRRDPTKFEFYDALELVLPVIVFHMNGPFYYISPRREM